MGAKGMRVDTSEQTARKFGGRKYVAEVWSQLPKCPDCGRPMRPHGSDPAKFPATVQKAGGGYCSTHYASRRAKGSLPGDRKVDYPPATGSEMQRMAATWSEEERSAAVLVADVSLRMVGECSAKAATTEILEMLGLFDADRNSYAYDLNDPKGAAAGRY
ncbi:hypothetical protein SEA_TEDRO_83 [Microbacterium phage Tedro]|nr:hypothetical protein SEA_TEDRO_83 [Microbacterium phage Tedro]